MPTELKYMLLWVCAALVFIALIICLWMMNVGRLQKESSHGLPKTHTPQPPPAYMQP